MLLSCTVYEIKVTICVDNRDHISVVVVICCISYPNPHCTLLKGLRMVARALWRSEARRVVPWSETLHEP